MSIPVARSSAAPEGPPPRTNGTPSGYRNIRVLTPNSLHFRLVVYAGLSLCSLNEFVLKVLDLATPIDPATGRPVPAGTHEMAPGHRPGHDPQGGPSLAKGTGAAQTATELAPCHRPGQGPLDGPGSAVGPGASPSPGALAGSPLDRAVDGSSSGPFPTADAADSPSAQDHDTSNHGGQAHA